MLEMEAKMSSSNNETDPLAPDDGATKGSLPAWLTCIMGCEIDETKEVVTLDCLHFICSDECIKKLRMESKSKTKLECKKCSAVVEPDHLSIKIVPENIFIKKKPVCDVVLICDNCVWNRPAVGYCAECPALLCETCRGFHPQTRATQKHVVVEDLTDLKERQLVKIKEDESKCKNHSQVCASYCDNCDSKICDMCLPAHEKHVTYIIQNERKVLQSKVDIARKLRGKIDRAVLAIGSKKLELLTVEWNNLEDQIHENFTAMARVLCKRREELTRAARNRFRQQVLALHMRSACAELSKSSSEQFIQIGEDILNNLDDVASAKFLKHFEKYVQWLCATDSKFTTEFDRYVDKDWHFQLDTSSNLQAQKYLSEYCQLEYICKPDGLDNLKTLTSTLNNSDLAALPSDNLNISQPIRNNYTTPQESRKTPSRRIAVKSTATAQLSAKKLKADIPSRVMSLRALDKVPNKSADVETEVEEGNKSNEQPRSRSRRPNLWAARNNAKDDELMEVATTVDDEQRSIESELIEVVSNGDAQTDIIVGSSSSSDDHTTDTTLPGSTRLDSEKENVQGVLKSKDTTTPRPSGASPDSNSIGSSVSESSERGLGKRERKKKSFPEFVDSDQSLKLLRKQTSGSETSASTRVRRKSAKLNAPAKSSRLLFQHQQEHEVKEEEDEVVPSQFDDEDWHLNSEMDIDETSDDDYGSETGPSRRHSLRRRAAQTPDTPDSSSNKRTRASKVFDESVFPEVPESSLEGAPESCDFPIQGQGRMKISSWDENEDYCCICLDGGEEIIVCCDFCPKVFHLKCHLPIIKEIPEGEAKWRCNYETSKQKVDEEIAACPDVPDTGESQLDESNKRHFMLACKFVMECYKIPESPTIRFTFPVGYLSKFGKAPVHLKYIREKLCLGTPEHFRGVSDMLLAFRHLFTQASMFYKTARKPKYRQAATACFEKFLDLINEYYPDRRVLFTDVEF